MTSPIRTRFFFTVATNLVRGLLSFVTGMLLARWLGPQTYGSMAFLLGTFLGIRQLLDMGTSSAFFTFLSQKTRTRSFVYGFFVWMAVQFLVPLIAVGLFFPSTWIDTLWLGEPRGLVLLAFAAAFLQHSVWPAVQQAGEAQRQTLWVQSISLVVVGIHLIAVVLFWWLGYLGLYAIFSAIAVEYILAAVVAQKRLFFAPTRETGAPEEASESAWRMYWRYCLPLIPHAWASFAYEFADRWLLQKFGGSVEQAFYAVSAQFAGVALIATTSIIRIFWKEIAEAHHSGNHARTGFLYKKVSRLLFFIGALIAGYMVPWSENILDLVLGTIYAGGASTLAIMFVFPVHQSLGQISLTMLMATEQTRVRVITAILFMVASVIATYLVLAPPQGVIPGLGLASEGLAWKMVGMQILSANVFTYLIARLWKWPFDWVHQPFSLLGCLALGWIAHFLTLQILSPAWNALILMALGGVVYLFLVAIFVYTMPWLAGMTRDELVGDLQKARRSASEIWSRFVSR